MSGRYFEGTHPELVARLESHFARVRGAFEDHGWRGALVRDADVLDVAHQQVLVVPRAFLPALHGLVDRYTELAQQRRQARQGADPLRRG